MLEKRLSSIKMVSSLFFSYARLVVNYYIINLYIVRDLYQYMSLLNELYISSLLLSQVHNPV